MSGSDRERFYDLLPALYRKRDADSNEALRALLAVLQGEYEDLEADVTALYENWFAQTCDAWVLPYLADLVGIRGLSQQKYLFPSQRRQVLNTIAYRRRKGTLGVLEHVLRDVSGWVVSAVEFAERTGVTQHIRHRRPDRGRTAPLSQHAGLVDVDGPFGEIAHTADVRAFGAGRGTERPMVRTSQGKYNLNQVGLFIWRLRSYPSRGNFAYVIDQKSHPGAVCCTFDPLGRDIPLFNVPQAVTDISQRVSAVHAPGTISRAWLAADLGDYRAAYLSRDDREQPPNSALYGPQRNLNIVVDRTPLTPAQVLAVDLSDWQSPRADAAYSAFGRREGPSALIDPEMGRLVVINAGLAAYQERIVVRYGYGFSYEIGGGPYRRHYPGDGGDIPWHVDVAKGTEIDTLQEALRRWDAHCLEHPTGPAGIIRFLDNGLYEGPMTVHLPAQAWLAIVADNGVHPNLRPRGAFEITCRAAQGAPIGAQVFTLRETVKDRRLYLNGLRIDGLVQIGQADESRIEDGRLQATIEHCTLMPAGIAAAFDKDLGALDLTIDSCIAGPLYVPPAVTHLTVTQSIIDHGDGYAIAGLGAQHDHGNAADASVGPGPAVTLDRVTVFGRVFVSRLEAFDSILAGPVRSAGQVEAGQVRSSYAGTETAAPGLEAARGLTPDIPAPVFTSTRFGEPGYAQLSLTCPPEIRGGAADGAEMGAFHDLHQVLAEANVDAALAEYLPLGLKAGIIYVT